MGRKELTLATLAQIAIGIDQVLNTLMGILTLLWVLATGRRAQPCWADETLSAHAWRAAVRGKRLARFFLPIVDALFFWQATDPEVDAAAGRSISGHCERAHWKERLRRNSPPEQREVTTP